MDKVEEKLQNISEEKTKERLGNEMIAVKIELGIIKTHGMTVVPGIGSNKIKPPTFETYKESCGISGRFARHGTWQLKTRKQKVAETLQDFENDVRKLTHMAFP